ncbi:CopG family transcriptional regulator [Halobacteriales archaeon QS_6_71_20]|nr:MAG: CopG family transcriptional regulator [Halobacteriales archaeon QS_6_71_20]
MSGEQVQGLPDVLREWVESRAAETGRSPDEVLARAVRLSRLLDEHDDALPSAEALADGDDAARLDIVESRVDELDAELDEKIEDVRSRVVQLKRETDAKADADHDHADLREAAESAAGAGEVDAVADDVEAAEAEVAELEATVTELSERFEDGFANYEEVLEYLTDSADEHDAKLSTLASVLSDVRTRLSRVEAREARRRAAEELQAEANRIGVASASCSACGSTVRPGLLSSPECPHCGATFEAVEPADGFLGSPTLAVGDRPALAGETVEESDAEDVFEGT